MKNLNLVMLSFLSIMLFTSCDKLEDIFGDEKGNEEESILENVPDYCDIQTIDGWSNVRFCKNGIVIFTKNFDGTQQISKALMFVPSKDCGITSIYGEYDEVGMPKYLSFDDAVVFIEDYKDGRVNLSLIQGKDYMWGDEDIEIDTNTVVASTRAWNENNWVRNTCAIGGAITSAIGIGAGVAVTGSGVGAAGGLLMIGASSKALADNLEVLFGPGDDGNFEISDYAVNKLQNIGMETMVDMLTKNEESYLKTLWPDKFDFKNGLPDTPNTFWIDLALEMVDAKWGKTVTEAAKRRAFIIAHLGYQIVTGRADEITEHTARLYGYISPDAMSPLGKFAEVEYGIVVYQTDNEEKRIAIADITGQASAFNLLFRGLDYNTEYTYFTYYYDKTNAAFRQGELKTFKTQGEADLELSKYEIEENPLYKNGAVNFKMNIFLKGNKDGLNDIQQFGYYIKYANAIDYKEVKNLSSKFESTPLTYELSIPRDGFSDETINYTTFEAKPSIDYYIGVYVVLKNGNIVHFDEETIDGLVYNTEPSIGYNKVSVVGTSQIDSYTYDDGSIAYKYETNYTYEGYITGAFWIQDVSSTCSGSYTYESTDSQVFSWGWRPSSDSIINVESGIRFWDNNLEPCIASLQLTLDNGRTINADNSLYIAVNPTNTSISIIGGRSIQRSFNTNPIHQTNKYKGAYPTIVIPSIGN